MWIIFITLWIVNNKINFQIFPNPEDSCMLARRFENSMVMFVSSKPEGKYSTYRVGQFECEKYLLEYDKK